MCLNGKSSEFEVELPLEYKNICGITVLDI